MIDPENNNGGRLVYVSDSVGMYRNADGVDYGQDIDELQVVAGRDCPAVGKYAPAREPCPTVDKY